MPIDKSWVSMIRALGKTYSEGTKKCRELKGGGKICIPEKAWSVFFGVIAKKYGRGAEMKPMPKKTQETIEEIVRWVVEEGGTTYPRWVVEAIKALKSDSTPPKEKIKIREKLIAYFKKSGQKPPYPLLKGSKIRSGGRGRGLGRGKGEGPMGVPTEEALETLNWFLKVRRKNGRI